MVFPESDDEHALHADDQTRARGPYAALPVVKVCCTSRGVLRPLIREAHLSEEHESQTEMFFFARFHASPVRSGRLPMRCLTCLLLLGRNQVA